MLDITPSQQIIRLTVVIKMTGLSRSSIYYKLDPDSRYYDPSFPKRCKLGLRAVGWLRSEIEAWIAAITMHVEGDRT